MEAALLAATSSAMNAVNLLVASTGTPRFTLPSTLTSPWPHPTTKPNSVTLCAPNHSNRFVSRFLTRCSTKPNTDKNYETHQDSSFEAYPNFENQNPSSPTSKEALSSSSSSLPSSYSSSAGLVLDLGPAGSWDSKEVGSPVVKRFLSDEEERWYMWYHGDSGRNPASDSIGLAISSNGIHWERGTGAAKSSGNVGLVMSCGKDWWAFDTESIRPGEVVIMSSAKVRASSAVYWLYYTGYSNETIDITDNSIRFNLQNPERGHANDFESSRSGKICRSLPGLAISQDGRHWARIEGEHHSGALFDVGLEGEWDALFIAAPKVVYHGNGDLRMYYHSFDVKSGEFCIGIARSRDGINWIKLGRAIAGGETGGFDERGVMHPSVVRKKDGKYMMAYEGIDAEGRRSIGLAVSSDGLKQWTKVQDEAVLKAATNDGWDNKGTGSPCLVQMDGDVDEWRLYYRGLGTGGTSGIGMAISEGTDFTRFRRWTGFQCKL